MNSIVIHQHIFDLRRITVGIIAKLSWD